MRDFRGDGGITGVTGGDFRGDLSTYPPLFLLPFNLIHPIGVYTLIAMDTLALDETRNCLCLAARRAARSITRQFDEALRQHGLRSTQFSALAVLSLAGPKTVKELAGILGADRTTMTRNLGVLEAGRLVTIRRGDDARERVTEITAEGRRRIESAMADWQVVQQRITQSMGDEAADSLRAIAWSQHG